MDFNSSLVWILCTGMVQMSSCIIAVLGIVIQNLFVKTLYQCHMLSTCYARCMDWLLWTIEMDQWPEVGFECLLNEERSCKPDLKMFHMMIFMYKEAENYDQARRTLPIFQENRWKENMKYSSVKLFPAWSTNFSHQLQCCIDIKISTSFIPRLDLRSIEAAHSH